MNFIDFLKNNSVVSFNLSPPKNEIVSKKITKKEKFTNKDTDKNTNKDTNKHSIKNTNQKQLQSETQLQEQDIYSQLQKGNFVKIVKYKNSIYNYFKVYIGEIKEINHYQNYVVVFLHPTHNYKVLRLHIDHVIKL